MRNPLTRSYRLLQKARYWNRNSAPYLSGDLFADNADYSAYAPHFRLQKNTTSDISEARVIFCPSHNIEQLLTDYSGKINAKVLILGNSDHDFHSFEYQLPGSVKLVLAQNLNFNDSRFKCLPIGLENLRLARNGFPNLVSNAKPFYEKTEKLLVGPLSPTHAERQLLNIFESTEGSWEYLSTRLTPKEYNRKSSTFKYVATPRGNGLDTHRFWETFYRGSIPVIAESQWSRQLKYLSLPIIEIEDWSIESYLGQISHNRIVNSGASAYRYLWWPEWKKLISSYV